MLLAETFVYTLTSCILQL